MRITKLTAESILDSRNTPTVSVTLTTDSGTVTAHVPSGKSTGTHEAVELRDPDGGVTSAVTHINTVIAGALVDHDYDWSSQQEIDQKLLDLDGTDNKSNLGANSLLGVSIATCRAFAQAAGVPVWKYIAESEKFIAKAPRLFANVLNGGAHADFALPFQEYMIVPHTDNMEHAYQTIRNVIKTLKQLFPDAPEGDEGGLSPKLETVDAPFQALRNISDDLFDIAIDAAATEFFTDGVYHFLDTDYSADELIGIYEHIVNAFAVTSIEDPFAESAVDDFINITGRLGHKSMIVGDDLTTTNPDRITTMAEQSASNAVIIKPNQIGTLSEVYAAVRTARSFGWHCIASHRSGETTDSFIADLAVGIGAYGIKAGSPLQPERAAKYERLVAISKELTV